MVKIIFSRIGKKKKPQYRIVAMDKQKDPWGDNLEILGHYNPHTKELVLKEKEIKAWLEKGAQPSDTIHNLLIEKGIIKDKKRAVSTISKKRTEKLAEKDKEKKAAEEKPAEAKEEKQEASEPVTKEDEKKEGEKEPAKTEEKTPETAPEEEKKDAESEPKEDKK